MEKRNANMTRNMRTVGRHGKKVYGNMLEMGKNMVKSVFGISNDMSIDVVYRTSMMSYTITHTLKLMSYKQHPFYL